MRVSAKVDYAVRAAVELAAHGDETPMKAERISENQHIPRKFLDNILQTLRQAGIVDSRRGPDGGHLLARPADQLTIADVIRAVDGPLVGIAGRPPESVEFPGTAAPLRETWVAARASLRSVLEAVTLADVAAGALPKVVGELTASPDAWRRR